MTTFHERSAGVIPYRLGENQVRLYLILHSATVRNPRANWEFPKGGVESGESTRQAAAASFMRRRRSPNGHSVMDSSKRCLTPTFAVDARW